MTRPKNCSFRRYPVANSAVVWHDFESMNHKIINFRRKFDQFTEHWTPKVVAEMNDYQFKVVKLQGDFIWHDHQDTDETFIVIEGDLRIDFRDGAVHVGAGEMIVVPRGIEHKPFAEKEVKLLLIEPRGVLNTGHEGVPGRQSTTFGFDRCQNLLKSNISAGNGIPASVSR
jgi:mannose-6-phosphate isomerase-like protein (cupin superfamily)